MLPDYFKILEIPKDASEMEIKRAYRSKSREFHPSENKSSSSLDNFILVNEAYEVLIHKNTHEIYLADFNTNIDPLGSEIYYYWINYARTRAAQHAAMTMKEFLHTKFFQNTHMYSYGTLMVFLVLGIILLFTPFVTMLTAQEKLGVPGVLAVTFIAWPMGLYFFVLAASGFQSMKKYMR